MMKLTFAALLVLAGTAYAAGEVPTEVGVTTTPKTVSIAKPAAGSDAGQKKGSAKSDFYGNGASETPDKKAKGKAAAAGVDSGKKGSQVDPGKEDGDGDKKDLALPQASQDGVGEQSVLPEIQMKAMLSASDVNRLVCGTDIKDVTFSKEKGVMVKYSGKNAFVKFAVTKQGEKTLYAVNPVELFVICGESVFNIIAIPKRIPSQTVRLNSGKLEKIQKNHDLHTGQTFEKKLLDVIKYAYTDELPESYSITHKSVEMKSFRDATCVLKRDIAIDGEGLVVHEYYMTPKENIESLVFSEKDFLKKEFANRPVAVSADKLQLRKGEVARVFVVDAKEADRVEQP